VVWNIIFFRGVAAQPPTRRDWRRISAPYLSAVVRKLVTFLAADLDLAGFEQFYDIAIPNISLK
jgi:hypothetical protein